MNTKFLLSSDNNNRSELLKKKIIHYYIANGDATIADLGREMDLSIPTVTKLVAELQDDGYILDFGKQETSGGRKPNIYGLNPASGYFVGVDILKDKLNIAAIDFKGDKVQLEENIPYRLENSPASLEQFCKIIDDFIVSLPVERNKILAIGVNITGRVNPASGYSYSIFYFEERPLAQILEERLQAKVFIENDSRAMTYGEYMKGAVQGGKEHPVRQYGMGIGIGNYHRWQFILREIRLFRGVRALLYVRKRSAVPLRQKRLPRNRGFRIGFPPHPDRTLPGRQQHHTRREIRQRRRNLARRPARSGTERGCALYRHPRKDGCELGKRHRRADEHLQPRISHIGRNPLIGRRIYQSADQERHPQIFAQFSQPGHGNQNIQIRRKGRRVRGMPPVEKQAAWHDTLLNTLQKNKPSELQ